MTEAVEVERIPVGHIPVGHILVARSRLASDQSRSPAQHRLRKALDPAEGRSRRADAGQDRQHEAAVLTRLVGFAEGRRGRVAATDEWNRARTAARWS